MKNRIFDISDLDFAAVRKDLTNGVYGSSLISNELSTTKVTLTKVEPNGEFSTHIDDYHHVLYFIKGDGVGWLGDEEFIINQGMIVNIPAGTPHGYRNSSQESMLLITINIPVQ